MASRSIPIPDRQLLFGRSAAFCAFPGCGARLVADRTDVDPTRVLAEIAHILGHSDAGPRADSSMPDAERDKYDNLILLCPTHHTLVDKQSNTYTPDDLRSWKASLEAWADQRLTEGASDFRFAELTVICDALIANASVAPSTPLVVAQPGVKMAYNDLTDLVGFQMKLGLMQAPQVEQFLAEYAGRIDASFPGRLRKGFLTEYERLWDEGLRGDPMFFGLVNFATNSSAGRVCGH